MAEKDFRGLMDAMREQGWLLERATSGHQKATPPNGSPIVFFATHSGDPRALKNAIRDLRKSGLVWPTNGNGEASPAPLKIDEKFLGNALFHGPEVAEAMHTDPDVDSLFGELKAARDDHALALLDVLQAEEQLAQAKDSLSKAVAYKDEAAARLVDAKRQFDAAFIVESCNHQGART